MACDPDLTLRRALRLQETQSLALVGAGGKSSAMFQLGREFDRALLACATHLGAEQANQAASHLVWPVEEDEIRRAVQEKGNCLVTGGLEKETAKWSGLPAEGLARLKALSAAEALPLLIEADGSRGKALKAPAEHEPALPPFAEVVVVCAGLSGLNQPLNAENVHRPEQFAALSGLGAGDRLQQAALLRVLLHPQGGQKAIPPGARRVLLLNQADDENLQAAGCRLAESALSSFDAVVVAQLRAQKVYAAHERTAAVVLAAGQGQRFGGPKQLLEMNGTPLVRRAAETALQAGFWPVMVVVGAYAEQTRAALTGLPLEIVDCPGWQEGQAAALRAGTRAAQAAGVGAALFLLADQPFVSVALLRALREHHARRLDAVTAPYVFDQRANPVLFDAVTFDALLTLKGNLGGRGIFDRFPPRYLPWYDRRLLLDVDTPEAWQNVKEQQ